MATFNDQSTKQVTCPFDPAHRILEGRLAFHIIKCQKNHENEKKICHFNASHRINSTSFNEHILTCPDRHEMLKKITDSVDHKNSHKGMTDVPKYFQYHHVQSESWDEGDLSSPDRHLCSPASKDTSVLDSEPKQFTENKIQISTKSIESESCQSVTDDDDDDAKGTRQPQWNSEDLIKMNKENGEGVNSTEQQFSTKDSNTSYKRRLLRYYKNAMLSTPNSGTGRGKLRFSANKTTVMATK